MSITAKSVVFDIADNRGNVRFIGLRSVEFFLNDVLVDITGFTSDATTSFASNYGSDFLFDPTTTKDGTWGSNQWLSADGNDDPARVIVVFSSPIEFDKIVINNSHNTGSDTDSGANNVVVTTSDDVISSTAYNDIITTPTVLFDGVFAQHKADNAAYPTEIYPYIDLIPSPVGDTTVKATSNYGSFYGYTGVDPLLSLTGSWSRNQWLTDDGVPTEQKFNVDIGNAVPLHRIVLNNSWSTPEADAENSGIQNFTLWGTNESTAFDNTTYADETDLTLIATLVAQKHVDSDVEDPQEFIIEEETAYRYYVLKIEDNWGDTRVGIRDIDFIGWTPAGPTPVVVLLAVLEQEWDLLEAVLVEIMAVLKQPYDLRDLLLSVLDQPWGDIFTAVLKQEYGDKAVLTAVLNQFYDDKLMMTAVLKQKYEDKASFLAVLKQPYTLRALHMAVLLQTYRSVDLIPPAVLKQLWDIKDTTEYLTILRQSYSLVSGATPQPVPEFSVTINGAPVDVVAVDYSYNIESYSADFRLQLAEYSDWLSLDHLQPVVVTVGAVEHHTVVSEFNSSESSKSDAYPVVCRSIAVLLDFPYAKAVDDTFNANGTAFDICYRLAQLEGLALTWHMNSNPPLTENDIHVIGDSPLNGIRSIVNELGGRVQSHPDGSIHLIKRHKYNTDKYDTVVPDHTLTTVDDFDTVSTNTVKQYGYNKYTVSSVSYSDSYTLSSEAVSEGVINIKASKVPWASDTVNLETSELTNVSIIPKGLTHEAVSETVEIVNGEGRTADPFYGNLSYTYPDRVNLGGVTVQEDGTVRTAIAGTTLLNVTYDTRYWLWETRDTDSEEVQFILVKP